MILKADDIANRMDLEQFGDDPLILTPSPDLEELRGSGAASVDLRLGTWFLELRRSRTVCLEVSETDGGDLLDDRHAKMLYTAFGGEYVLHPGTFVLGVTLEWLRVPRGLVGYVVGKSSWGRRGLIIATAVGVHPGFTGCLTLEICNVGEIPIVVKPGMSICQLFLHTVNAPSDPATHSQLAGYRKPVLGRIQMDEVAKRLSRGLL